MSLWTGDEIWFLELKQHFLLWSSSSVWSTEIRLSPSLSNLCSYSPSLNLSLARSPCSIWAWGIAAWDGELMKKAFFLPCKKTSKLWKLCTLLLLIASRSAFMLYNPVKHKYLTSLFSSPWEYVLHKWITSIFCFLSWLNLYSRSPRNSSNIIIIFIHFAYHLVLLHTQKKQIKQQSHGPSLSCTHSYS